MATRPSKIQLGLYGLPAFALGFSFLFLSNQLMYFGTNVLLLGPGVLGSLLFLARLWDAVTDPAAGYLSDITRTGWGRRRPWLFAAAIPLGVAFFAIWWIPVQAAESSRAFWLSACVILYFTAHTAATMPHDALGAELVPGYRDRTRVFAAKRIAHTLGSLTFLWFASQLAGAPASTFQTLALPGSLALAVFFIAAAVGIREPLNHQRRPDQRPPKLFRSLASVWRNRHARVLITVFIAQQLAIALLLAGMPYFSEYVLNDPQALAKVFLVVFATTVLAIPIWTRIGDHFEKKPLVITSMLLVGIGLGTLAFGGAQNPFVLYAAAFLAGIGNAGADILLPSLQADAIDADELETGQRNEGVYFATWALVLKFSYALAWAITGFALELVDFEPAQVQPERALFAIQMVTGGAPFVIYLLGVLSFLRFQLDEAEHTRIRTLIDARADPRT